MASFSMPRKDDYPAEIISPSKKIANRKKKADPPVAEIAKLQIELDFEKVRYGIGKKIEKDPSNSRAKLC